MLKRKRVLEKINALKKKRVIKKSHADSKEGFD